MNGSLTQILESPRLVEFHDQIGRTLERERATRQRFRDHLDEGRREEFINGEVVVHVPTALRHADCLGRLDALFSTHVKLNRLGTPVREQALVEFPRNDYCPDFCFWPRGSGVGEDPAQTIFPPPPFAIEVLSPSTEERDRGVKFEDYEAHGVKEYWIVDPEKRTIEQYVEHAGKYHRMFNGSEGVIRSVVVPRFEMPVAAAFDDAAQVAALRAIMSAA